MIARYSDEHQEGGGHRRQREPKLSVQIEEIELRDERFHGGFSVGDLLGRGRRIVRDALLAKRRWSFLSSARVNGSDHELRLVMIWA